MGQGSPGEEYSFKKLEAAADDDSSVIILARRKLLVFFMLLLVFFMLLLLLLSSVAETEAIKEMITVMIKTDNVDLTFIVGDLVGEEMQKESKDETGMILNNYFMTQKSNVF